ncbi:MAG: hypothetical protein CMJ41_00885 [Phycisphaerae bacterium]|nr:hypothetical protein [Phycisphaerae bacterium]
MTFFQKLGRKSQIILLKSSENLLLKGFGDQLELIFFIRHTIQWLLFILKMAGIKIGQLALLLLKMKTII